MISQRILTILDNFIQNPNNSMYINNLNQIINYCLELQQIPFYPTTDNNYSKTININESINLIIKFLDTIDKNLSEQFQSYTTMTNEFNKPMLNFINDRTYYEKYPEELTEEIKEILNNGSSAKDGKAYIVINNSLDDIFNILHEVFHCMNQYKTFKEENGIEIELSEAYTRDYLGEAVSIISEKFLGQFLVKNNYITQNDFNIRLNKRLQASKEDSKAVIVENALIDIRRKNIDIPTYLSSIKNQKLINILKEELQTNKITASIISANKLNFPYRQRYVIGTYLSNKYSYQNSDDIKKFISLNNEVGIFNSNIDKIKSTL